VTHIAPARDCAGDALFGSVPREKTIIVKTAFVVWHWGADSTLVDAQPFKDVGILSVWLKIAFIYEDSECLSGTTQL